MGELDLAAEVGLPSVAATATVPGSNAGSVDLLSRLRMPGQPSGSHNSSSSQARPSAPQPASIPVNQRTPNTGSISGLFAAFPAAVREEAPAASRPENTESSAQRLKNENKELRKLLNEMKQLLQEASDTEQAHAAQNVELQTALAEKSRQVEEATEHLRHFEEQISSGALAPVQPQKNRTELEEWADELERENSKLTKERKVLDEERKQLREDEESLEKQMRQMEVSMAKDRAIMARQEIDLRRLHAEIQSELEIMQRGDATLREHMQRFQRRAQEVMTKPAGGAATNASGMWARG
ncbi:MAG TPA: hypothetical protein VGJ05_01635 [Fimbriiglobus sp.]